MHEQIRRIIIGSDAYALATSGPYGVNVVPLSVVEVRDDEIHLYDFFMSKTAENIKAVPEVALACWQGFRGVQVKAEAVYETSGEVYEAAVTEMKERFPDRMLAGVIRLTPTAVYDVAPGASGDDLLR
ncbi:pyridoxamine 5'-phosphate oxidase family protein [Candidatus Kaiserbacteria bacterium]|nr:pyridoxamine 5'-phosphate oxidase family protein [Candidatus Kaiserbacteria bacterium]MCB9812489.1 pyridoxamine 5'-phosphate oxidase family protein [Candidatus Nomurabacteria bacterium]